MRDGTKLDGQGGTRRAIEIDADDLEADQLDAAETLEDRAQRDAERATRSEREVRRLRMVLESIKTSAGRVASLPTCDRIAKAASMALDATHCPAVVDEIEAARAESQRLGSLVDRLESELHAERSRVAELTAYLDSLTTDAETCDAAHCSRRSDQIEAARECLARWRAADEAGKDGAQ